MSVKSKIKNAIRLLIAKEMVPIYQLLQQGCEGIIARTNEGKLSNYRQKL